MKPHCKTKYKNPGASIPPETMMHFPPLFQISPLFQKNFRTFWKILTILPFPKHFLDFHPPKFLMTFFSHQPQISNFPPVFPVSVHFLPVSRKLLFPPYFQNFPHVFDKFTCFLHTLCVFRFPPTLTMMHLCITQCMYWTPLWDGAWGGGPVVVVLLLLLVLVLCLTIG